MVSRSIVQTGNNTATNFGKPVAKEDTAERQADG